MDFHKRTLEPEFDCQERMLVPECGFSRADVLVTQLKNVLSFGYAVPSVSLKNDSNNIAEKSLPNIIFL